MTQRTCPGEPSSTPGDTTVKPCSALPAPTVSPILDGATSVILLTFVPDAIIKVYVNLVKRGEGGGPIVQLTTPVVTLALGDAVLFRGCELPHWRETASPDQFATMLLFHYVPIHFVGVLA